MKILAALAALTVTNTATDSDLPVNLLVYNLQAAPAGVAIDANGVITWTPNAGQGSSTNTITTIVTDYNPWALSAQHLSTTNSFTVIVTAPAPAPVIQSIGALNGVATLQWSSVPNRSYRLQYKQNVMDLNWSNVVDVTATGSVVTATNNITGVPQRFYRVMLLP